MLSLAAGSLASAQSDPAPRQMACRSDAGKILRRTFGKPPQMNACLKANKADLSDGCRKVVVSRGGQPLSGLRGGDLKQTERDDVSKSSRSTFRSRLAERNQSSYRKI
jgi:hypothetical protein